MEALSRRADILVPDTASHETMSDLAASILSDLPQTFALAGHSMGGYVALEIMSQAAERVSKLALLSTSARLDLEEVAQRRRDFITLAERGRFLGVSPGLFAVMVHEDRSHDANMLQIVQSMAQDIGAEGFGRQQKAILSRSDQRNICPSISCPTLVLAGAHDAVVPFEASDELARLIPHTSFVHLEGCGHLPTLEAPDDVTVALEKWLNI